MVGSGKWREYEGKDSITDTCSFYNGKLRYWLKVLEWEIEALCTI